MWEAIIFAVIALGGMVASRILSARRKPKQQEIESLEVPSASEGRPIPVVFGTVDLKNSNVVWWGDIKQVAVKQDGQTVNYKYYVGLHLALHMGHADRLVNLQIDEKLVFSNVSGAFDTLFDRLSGGDRSLSYEELFGGQFKDGGFSGTLDFDTGEPDQTYNDYLNGAMNTNPNEPALIKVPAYRGITGLIARQCYIGTSSYMRPWIVRTQRILKRFDGIDQWYIEKSIIKTAADDIILSPTEAGFKYKIIDPSITPSPVFEPTYGPGWTPFYFNSIMENWDSQQSYIDFHLIPFIVAWTTETLDYTFDGTDNGAFGHNYTGEYTINVDWTLKRVLCIAKSFESTGKYDFRVTGYIDSNTNAKLYIVLDDKKLVLNAHTLSQYEFVINSADIPAGEHVLRIIAINDYLDETTPDVSDTNYFAIKIDKESSNSMNPAHIVREILTDPDWGMNHLESDIDDESFIIAADKLYTENFGLCLEWDRQSRAESFMNEVLQHINGQVYNDRSTGKFVLKLIRDDYVKSLLNNITETKIKSLSGFKKQMLPELVNEVVLTYWDLDLGLESTISIQDGALVQKQDGVNSKSISYRGIVSSEVANKVCRRDLNVLSSPLISFSILVTNQISDFSIGDVFNVTFPDYNIDDMTVRISGITYGDGVKNDIVIQVVQDIFSLPDDGFYIQGEVGWEAPSTVIPAIFASLAMEIPYFKLAALQGQASIDSALSTLPTIGYVAAVAGRPSSNAINADVYRDTGSGYTYNNTIDFCPYCLLGENIDRTQTSFSVVAEVETDSLSVGTILQIDEELMSVVSLVSGTLTVKRGVYDSIVAEHLAESYVMFWSEFVENLFTQYNDGDSVDSKILTRTGDGVLELADVDELTVDLASRAVKPYPPGNLKINGIYFPETDQTNLVVTWEHRDRKNLSLVGFPDTGITSEAGVTYDIYIRKPDETLLNSYLDINNNTITIDYNDFSGNWEYVIFEIESKRSALTSYYRYVFNVPIVQAPFPFNFVLLSVDNTGNPTDWTSESSETLSVGSDGYWVLSDSDNRAVYYQEISLISTQESVIDAGNAVIDLSHVGETFPSDNDDGVAFIEFFDVSDNFLKRAFTPILNSDTEVTRSISNYPVPPLARYVRIGWQGWRQDGTELSVYVKNITAQLKQIATNLSAVVVYADYDCDDTGWTSTTGTMRVLTGSSIVASGVRAVFVGGATDVRTTAEKTFALPTGWDTKIAAGNVNFEFTCGITNANDDDDSGVTINFVSSASPDVSSGQVATTDDLQELTLTGAVPTDTTAIKIIFDFWRQDGTSNDACIMQPSLILFEEDV